MSGAGSAAPLASLRGGDGTASDALLATCKGRDARSKVEVGRDRGDDEAVAAPGQLKLRNG